MGLHVPLEQQSIHKLVRLALIILMFVYSDLTLLSLQPIHQIQFKQHAWLKLNQLMAEHVGLLAGEPQVKVAHLQQFCKKLESMFSATPTARPILIKMAQTKVMNSVPVSQMETVICSPMLVLIHAKVTLVVLSYVMSQVYQQSPV